MKQVPQLLGSNINKVGLPDFIRLEPNPIFPLDIIILTQELQELKRPPIRRHTLLIVDLLISRNGLKHILPQHKLLTHIIEVIVVNRCSRELVLWILPYIPIINILQYKLA